MSKCNVFKPRIGERLAISIWAALAQTWDIVETHFSPGDTVEALYEDENGPKWFPAEVTAVGAQRSTAGYTGVAGYTVKWSQDDTTSTDMPEGELRPPQGQS